MLDWTLDEVQAFVSGLEEPAPPDGAKTAVEWSATWGVGKRKALVFIKALQDRGVMKAGSRQGHDVCGRPVRTPVYYFEGEDESSAT